MAGRPRFERTPDGRRLVVSRTVDADSDAVWDLLTDTIRWPDWGPSVSGVRARDRYIRAGTTGRVQVVGGPWIPFEVGTCRPYRWTWRVAGVPATAHRVEPRGADCLVAFEIPLVAAPYILVCDRALDRIDRLVARS
ncbi:polyketide cyclase [Halobacteriales archaeon QH_10_67_22]|nr:MAG: polyketide cyclase [Halobacteriales archaeon QH_10_67_22]